MLDLLSLVIARRRRALIVIATMLFCWCCWSLLVNGHRELLSRLMCRKLRTFESHLMLQSKQKNLYDFDLENDKKGKENGKNGTKNVNNDDEMSGVKA